jgi:hypothetical protein
MPLKAAYIRDVYYARNTWCVPMVPVVDMYAWLEAHATEGFVISGVYGSYDHWSKPRAGDHTNRTTHDLWGTLPASTGTDNVIRRYVGAIDYKLPSGWMSRYESWCVAELRANHAPWVKYMNINGHHYHRETGYGQASSGDYHVHESFAPGFETKKIPGLLLTRFYNAVMHPTPEADMPLSDEDIRRIWGYRVFPASHSWLTTGVANSQVYLYLGRHGELRQKLDAIMNAQATLATSLATVAVGVASIDALDDQTRAQVTALQAELAAVKVLLEEALKAGQEPAPDPQ